MKKVHWIFFGLLLFSGVNALAQSLDELKRRAIDQHPELKALDKEYQAARERIPQVGVFPDPELGLGFFPLPVETRVGAQNLRFSANQPFPWFGTKDSQVELEAAKANVVQQKQDVRVLELTYELEKAYYQLYEWRQHQQIIRRNLPLLDALENVALRQMEAGKGAATDILKIQLKKEYLLQEIAILENKTRMPQIAINQFLYRPLDTPIVIEDSLVLAETATDPDAYLTQIQNEYPLIRMSQLQQEVSRQALQVNTLAGKPGFALGLDYILVNPRQDAEPVDNGRDILQLRAMVKVPLNRKRYEAKSREEQLKIDALDDRIATIQSELAAAIEKAQVAYETARLKIALYEQQKILTRSTIELQQKTYSSQGRGFDELLQLEMDLIDYDLKLLQAIVQSHLAQAAIKRFALH